MASTSNIHAKWQLQILIYSKGFVAFFMPRIYGIAVSCFEIRISKLRNRP